MSIIGRARIVAAMLVGMALLVGIATQGMALQVGDKAPDFALPATMAKEIKLGDYLGQQNVVVFFFIGAFTDT